MRQKSIRVFEVDDFERLKSVVESKYELLKNHFFLLKERNREIEEFLKEKGLKFLVVNEEGFTPCKEITPQIKVIEKEIIKEVKKETVIYDKIIRSGEEIKSDNNLIFLNRINAGAKIICSGNVEIYAECEGFVDCKGDVLIVKKNQKGTIFFRGEEIKEVEKLTLFTKNFKKVLQ